MYARHHPLLARAGLIRLVLLTSLALPLGCGPSEPPVAPPPEIAVADVVQRDQPIEMVMVGETLGSSDIPIRARVEGVVLGMHFTEGRSVEKDQLLYTIDPEPFEAEVVEAQGSLATQQTRLVKAKSDLDRIRPLAEMKAVSQSDLDGAVAQYQAAQGALQSANARVDQAKIRLGYTRIASPIAGRIGISEARVGEFVGVQPNPVVLNFVSQTDPIRVRFSIDEKTYLAIARRLRELQDESKDSSKLGAGLALTLADGTIHPYPGRIVAADASVDPKTGTFTFEADFANPEGLVLAGQFARVTAVAEVREGALLVPSRCASELQGSHRVYVIDKDNKVEMRSVELGPVVDNFRLVNSGLKPGERVALEIMKLQPGMTVNPRLTALDEKGTIVEAAKVDPSQSKGTPGSPAQTEDEAGARADTKKGA
jgi:membrane fusion protein (multidrug efflux system)